MAADRASDGQRAYRTFGWQGVNLTVPSDWDLAYTHGTYDSGRVKLADHESVRLDVRWRTARGAASPGETVAASLARLVKKARRDRVELDAQRNLNLASPPGKDVECYRWTGDRQVLAMLSRCPQCGRVVHLQLSGAPEEPLRRLARTVFSSLRDHPDGGTHLWSVFDVQLRTPAELRLARSSLQTGCIRLTFSKGSTRLEFVRVSLAEVLLAGPGLPAWFRAFHARRLRRRRFALEETVVKRHPGLRVEGRPWAVLNPGRLFGRARVLRIACWHCEASNRLFICAFDGRRRDAHWFEPAVAEFRCCEGEGAG